MKRTILTLAILMTMAFTATAQRDAFFKWNDADDEIYRNTSEPGFDFNLPQAHGLENDSTAPLGSGLIILGALGAGYAIKKKAEVRR